MTLCDKYFICKWFVLSPLNTFQCTCWRGRLSIFSVFFWKSGFTVSHPQSCRDSGKTLLIQRWCRFLFQIICSILFEFDRRVKERGNCFRQFFWKKCFFHLFLFFFVFFGGGGSSLEYSPPGNTHNSSMDGRANSSLMNIVTSANHMSFQRQKGGRLLWSTLVRLFVTSTVDERFPFQVNASLCTRHTGQQSQWVYNSI